MIWRKRLVRLHLEGQDPSLEGILSGHWDGHYILRLAKVIASTDGQPFELTGSTVKVPRERVIFIQELR